MKVLIELTTRENQVVLDPYCGSGTSLLAAQQCGRHYIGIEQDQHFCQVARERLERPTLFSSTVEIDDGVDHEVDGELGV